MAIKPGRMGTPPDPLDAPAPTPAEFANSMAAQMEEALRHLLITDGLPDFPLNDNSREARDRRRLFVAIARGIVRHLQEQANSITITVPDGLGGTTDVHPTFNITGGAPWP